MRINEARIKTEQIIAEYRNLVTNPNDKDLIGLESEQNQSSIWHFFFLFIKIIILNCKRKPEF